MKTTNSMSSLEDQFDKKDNCDTSIIVSKADVNIQAEKNVDKTIVLLPTENEVIFKQVEKTANILTKTILDENCLTVGEKLEMNGGNKEELILKGITTGGIKKSCIMIRVYSTKTRTMFYCKNKFQVSIRDCQGYIDDSKDQATSQTLEYTVSNEDITLDLK